MFLRFLPIILYLALIVFGIYFMVRVIKFMDLKIKLDQERNKKIDEIIKDFKQDKSSK
ncbi:hypothetical protein ACLM5H_25905 [Fredinandcohnia humi]